MTKRWWLAGFLFSFPALWACSSGKGSTDGGAGTGGAPGSGGGPTGGASSGGTGQTGGQLTGGNAPASGGQGTGGAKGGTGGGTSSGGQPTGGSNASGGAGNGGRATGGAAAGGSATGGSGASSEGESVLERNKHPSRDGHFLQPTLTKAAAAKMAMDTAFAATYTGAVWASPLYLENGPGGKGIFIVVTTGNDVIALDETTGAVVWMKNLGTPASSTGAGCGSIKPLGIISTPVIDAKTGTLYVAGTIGSASAITSQYVSALNVMDGTVKAGYPIDVSTKLNFDPKPHNQRSALSFVGGILYVAYGGHVGDCGSYRGRVVAVDTTANPPTVKGWQTGGGGEAIWAPGGMASTGDGVFAVTGNNTSGTRVDSEEVVHIRGMATLDKTGSKDWFYPASWQTMDRQDADFGAINPVILNIPGSASPVVAATSKDGHVYLLDSTNLGGTNDAPVDFTIASGAMSIHTVPTAYTAGSTTFLTMSMDGSWVGCPASFRSTNAVMGIAVAPGAPLKPSVVWCAAMTPTPNASDGNRGGPAGPIATTTNGSSDALVWYMSGTKLIAVDGATGETVFNGGAGDCMGVRKWTSPIAVKGRVVVAADNRLCSWSPH